MNEEKKLELTADEEAKVRAALEKLEQAQGLINHAAEDLCPVRGFADEWQASGAVHDTVKEYWHAIDARLAALRGIPPSTS